MPFKWTEIVCIVPHEAQELNDFPVVNTCE